VHVVICDHRIQPGEGRPGEPFPLAVSGAREHVHARPGPDVGHLLDARRDDDILHAARDRDDRLPEGKPAGCAGRLHTGRGSVVRRKTGVIRDQGTDVFLLDEPPGAHVPDVESVDPLAGDTGILERQRPGLDEEVAERGSPVLPELRASDSDYCYVSHFCITIFPLCLAYSA
jgi:hypothetical protein